MRQKKRQPRVPQKRGKALPTVATILPSLLPHLKVNLRSDPYWLKIFVSSFEIIHCLFLIAAADDDDVLLVDSDEEPSSSNMETAPETSNRKRKHQDADTDDAASKRKRVDQQPAEDNDDIIALD